ncbi:aldo/keto reductase [Aestuariimicrobium kwangyangense]|uniref:aldo/keto reductase n=1 Tax=Aestuariimicrobium kwangyangense TaxID=396389 RepID=UPI0004066AC0|nr:aldo/keto reductase [Aestuariimicrobium kwangyangense]
MKTRRLGRVEVSAIGLGCMGMSTNYGPSPERTELIAFTRKAHELGVTLFDTAQVYGAFANEDLVGEALEPIRDQVVIATKFGFDIDPDDPRQRSISSSPELIRSSTEGPCVGFVPTTSTCCTSTG